MKVKELIEALKAMPHDAEVTHLWDGEARTSINLVWLSRTGFVVTSDFSEVCYSNDTRPEYAPTQKESLYWQAPASGKIRKRGLFFLGGGIK
jgi:hypothetical protein